MLLASFASLLLILWQGSRLPDRVASHFNAAGAPDSFMAREPFVLMQILLVSLLPLLVWFGLMAAAGKGKLNMPHARQWLAPPHRGATLRFLAWHGAALSVSMVVFLSFVFAEVGQAHSAALPRLDSGGTLLHTGGYLVFVMAWVAVLHWRFRRRPGTETTQAAAGS